jgi:cell division septum initiation protein DivIVA
MSMTPEKLRSTELPSRFLGGFDEDATEELLEAAAKALATALAERDALQLKLDELKQASPQAASDGAEAIGSALLTAKRVADRVLAEAQDEAVQIKAEADAESERLLHRARSQAQASLARAEQQIAALDAQAETLRTTIAAHRDSLVDFIRSSVDQLAGPGASAEDRRESQQIETALRERLPEATNGTPADAREPDFRTYPPA